MNILSPATVRDIADIAIVSWLLYRGLILIRGTQAAPMLAGLGALALLYFIANWFGLLTVAWVLGSFLSSIILVVVVVFQEEIRRGLTKVGLNPIVRRNNKVLEEQVIEDVVLASMRLARNRTGGLIVIQREVGLDNLLESSVIIDGALSRKLLMSIFVKESPLHDGAVIINGDRIKAAGCVLPLSHNPDLDPNLGTRHRAAVGLSERSDAVVIIISEENGSISLAREGKLTRNMDPSVLRDTLHRFFMGTAASIGKEVR